MRLIIPKQPQYLVFGKPKAPAIKTIVSNLVLEIQGYLRSFNHGALGKPKSQILRLFGYTFFILFFNALSAEMGVMQFDPPKEWRLAELNDYPKSVQIVVVGKGKHTFPPQLILNTEAYEGTLNDYLKIVKEYNRQQKTDWKDLGTIRTEAGNASLSQVDVMTEWGVIRMMHLILIKDKVVFILNSSALKEEFSTFYSDFFHSMRSLRYTPPKNN